jgi:hypothetical protein
MIALTMKKTILSVIMAATGLALQAADDPAGAGNSSCCMESTSTTSIKAEQTMAAQSNVSDCSEGSCCCAEPTSVTATKPGQAMTNQVSAKSAKATAHTRTRSVLQSPKAMTLASR